MDPSKTPTDGAAEAPKQSSSRATIVTPPESHEKSTDSPTLRSSKSGWDGKLRLSDLGPTNEASKSDEEEEEEDKEKDEHSHDEQQDTDTDEETLVDPNNQPTEIGTRRTATVTTGEPIPGEILPNEEELLAEYESDSTEIDAIHCRVSSIKKLGLERFTALQRLCLRQNQITDMSKLPEILGESLEELDLYDNLIKHIRGIEIFGKLTSLDLSFNKIKHIKNVKHLKHLTDLYFVQNRITKIEELDGLDKIRNLELGGNQLREIENLQTLVSLEQLWLGKNKITSLRGLPLLPNLTILSIQSNRITQLENLSTALPALEELYISHNLLTSLTGVEECSKLRVLDVSSNQISKLKGLENLKDLEEFWASNCMFDNFEDVERQLRDKEQLETVYFEGTPLQKRQPVLYRNKVRLALPQVKQIDATYVRV